MSDISASIRILVYPDPANTFIRFNLQVSQNTNYHIYNTLGIQVRNGVLKSEEMEHQIGTQDLPEGVYFLLVSPPHQQQRGCLFMVKR